MFSSQLLRRAARLAYKPSPRSTFKITCPTTRPLSHSACRLQRQTPEDQGHDAATTSAAPGESGTHEGENARTDTSVRVEYPAAEELPPSRPVQGRGASHFKRTLDTFSMEGRVAVVTGGARGLGLVMAQALLTSGADVALVDLNRDEAQKSAQELVETYKAENEDSQKYE